MSFCMFVDSSAICLRIAFSLATLARFSLTTPSSMAFIWALMGLSPSSWYLTLSPFSLRITASSPSLPGQRGRLHSLVGGLPVVPDHSALVVDLLLQVATQLVQLSQKSRLEGVQRLVHPLHLLDREPPVLLDLANFFVKNFPYA